MTPQQHIERLHSSLHLTYGVSTDEVCQWDSLSPEIKRKLATSAGVGLDAVNQYSWCAMPNEVRERLTKAARHLFSKGVRSLAQIGAFVNVCDA
jgi:hypothetical protein